MSIGIRRLLAPPVFEGDEDKTRMAMLLNTILLVLLARAVLFRGISWLEEAAQSPRPGLFVPLTVLLLGMIFLMRRGYVRLASVITVISFWLSLTVVAVINGGIHSTGFRNYIIPVIIAGLLLGRWAAVSVAGLSILAGLVMWQAEISGLMPALLVPGTSLELLITHAISLLIIAVLVTLATRSIMEALERARQELVERRQAEEVARESENRWRTIFNDAAVGIALVNSEGHPIQCNPALRRMLGYTEEELQLMPFTEFTHPEDVDKDLSLYQELLEDKRGHYQMEKQYIRKDGQVVWGNLIVSMIRDERGRGQFAVAMVEDITERKRAEEENRTLLHDLGERVKELTALHGAARILQKEEADTLAVLCELASLLPPAFQYPEVTAARVSLGQTEAATPGFADSASILRSDFITADQQPGSIEVVYTEDCPPEAEGPFLVEERALINTLADMLRTSYDRQHAEMALRESEERFRAIAETIPASIFIYNSPRFAYMNPACGDLTGYTRDELSSMTVWEIVHPDMREAARTRMEARLRGDSVPPRFDFKLLTKSGQVRWAYSTAAAITYQGKPSTLSVVLDFTERKQAEEQLRATSEQLRALTASLTSAREEEGIRIAREIHDELGSALTSLRWDLESCDKVISESGDQLQPHILRQKIASMIRLTDTTVVTIRRISAELRPSILDDLGLVEAIEWQAQQFQTRTEIICHCDCAVESLDLNQERSTALFRIFQEALTNVLRHAQATRVDIEMKEKADEFILTISDNGVGINESQKSAARSLGLVGMRERAHLVGGEINITGVEGKGTVVTVRVPASD